MTEDDRSAFSQSEGNSSLEHEKCQAEGNTDSCLVGAGEGALEKGGQRHTREKVGKGTELKAVKITTGGRSERLG